ncbi:MAG: hypothetical protein SF053_08240 [Bacteroidia bacterium]|nr:hypothetical protein [Bacteroidia bacterium]
MSARPISQLAALSVVLLTLLALGACERVKVTIKSHTYDIFPHDSGHYRISLVIDTTYNTQGPVPDTYYKKELLTGEETDLTGRTARLIEVYRSDEKFGTDYNFVLSRIWQQYLAPEDGRDYYAERIEENVRYVLLKFPVSVGVSWNGNLYNNLGTQAYTYETDDTTVTVQGITYENCVLVVQKADTNSFIYDRFAYEIYAPGIGLIKKYDRNIVNNGPNGEFNASESYFYQEELLEHN